MKSQCRITLPIFFFLGELFSNIRVGILRFSVQVPNLCNQVGFAYLQVILLEDGSLHEVHVANGDGGEVDGVEGRRQRVHVGRHRVREEVEHGSEGIGENLSTAGASLNSLT